MRQIRLLAVLLLVCSIGAPAQNFETEAEGADEATFIVKTVADLPAQRQKDRTIKRLEDALRALPDGYSVRVRFDTFNTHDAKGEIITYISEVTPLNPDGKEDGVAALWEKFGGLQTRSITWVSGTKNGPERTYRGSPDGPVVDSEIPWVDGVVQGDKKEFHADGQIASLTPYVAGAPHGTARSYAASGKLIREITFVNGERSGEQIDYWDDSEQRKQIVRYAAGKVDGLAQAWYLDGTLKWERTYVDNALHGRERHFTADGALEKERYWLAGKEVTADAFAADAKND